MMEIKITEQQKESFIKMFRTPAGQEVRDFLALKFINVNDFDSDPYKNAYNSGVRGLALFLYALSFQDQPDVVGADYPEINYLDTDNTRG